MIHGAELIHRDEDNHTGRDMIYIKVRSSNLLQLPILNKLFNSTDSGYLHNFLQPQAIHTLLYPWQSDHSSQQHTHKSKEYFKVHEVHKTLGYQVVTKGEFHPDEFIDANQIISLAARVVRYKGACGGGRRQQGGSRGCVNVSGRDWV